MMAFVAMVMLAGVACAPGRNAGQTAQRASELARKKFPGGFEMTPNASGTFFLCTHEGKERPAARPINFFVYDAAGDSILLERELDNGSVTWQDDSSLVVTSIPGAISGDEDPAKFREIIRLKKAR